MPDADYVPITTTGTADDFAAMTEAADPYADPSYSPTVTTGTPAETDFAGPLKAAGEVPVTRVQLSQG